MSEPKLYRSHKQVHAEPMSSRNDYIQLHDRNYRSDSSATLSMTTLHPEAGNPDQPGYHAIYQKGTCREYHSWSPKKQFDEGYTEIVAPSSETPNKITQEHIDSFIVDADYHLFPGTTKAVCNLTLVNGFSVTGESACADPKTLMRNMAVSWPMRIPSQ